MRKTKSTTLYQLAIALYSVQAVTGNITFTLALKYVVDVKKNKNSIVVNIN